MLMRITFVDYVPKTPDDGYSVDDLTVRAVGRTENGDRETIFIEGTRPSCWVPADESVPTGEDYDWDVLDVEDGYRGIDIEAGEKAPVKRVVLDHPKRTRSFTDEFSRSWESDIPFYRRVGWDYGIYGYVRVPEGVSRFHVDRLETDIDSEDVDEPIEPRVAVGDIEVVDPSDRSFGEMERAADAPIKAVTWWDSYTDEYLVAVADPDDRVDGGEVREHVESHWADHADAGWYVDEPDITLVQTADEAGVLTKTVNWLSERSVDIVSGWNFVDFDWYYLLSRLSSNDETSVHDISPLGRVEMRKVDPDRRGVESAVGGLPAFDQMGGLDKQTYGEWRSKRLEFVANDQLGIGKIPDITVADAYEQDRSRLAAYNLLDVQLCVALTRMHGIEEFFLDLADLCGIQLQDAMSEKREVQGYIGARRNDDQIMPANVERDLETPAGGLVLTPGDGIYRDVAVFDLKSLYPSSIVTCNISPETMVDDIDDADVVVPGMPETESDVGGSIEPSDINWEDDDPSLPWSQRPKGFAFGEQGILPDYAEQMFPARETRKDRRDEHDPDDEMWVVWDNQQRGIKVVHNSMFGVENSRYFPLAKDGIGDAITGISRYILWRAAEYVRDLGYSVIYGDTDSLLVSMDYGDERRSLTEVKKDASGLQTQINHHMATVAEDLGLPADHPHVDASEMPHGLPDDANHLWFFEFEKLYDRFIQVGSKKRYAGTLTWKEGKEVDELDTTGVEAERSDQMEVTAEVQRQVLRSILDGDGFDAVSSVVRDEMERFRADAEDLHEIGVPIVLNKPIEEYPNRPAPRAFAYSNAHLGKSYEPPADARMYYVSRTPSFEPDTDVIALDWTDDIPEGYQLDREKTIEKAFESALEPVLDEMGWTWTEVKTGKQNQPAADESIYEYDGDPFASDGSDETDDEDEAAEDGPAFEGAGAW